MSDETKLNVAVFVSDRNDVMVQVRNNAPFSFMPDEARHVAELLLSAASEAANNIRMKQEAERRKAAEAIPVDRSCQILTDGSPVTPDHREIDPATGMQKEYVVLCDQERAKGFVRPVRRSYRHVKCGHVTSMGQKLAETYARDPKFYSGTFCCSCGTHFDLTVDNQPQFTWIDDGTAVGS